MSQLFSATEPTVTVEANEVIYAPDIVRNGSVFTDGAGEISPELGREIVQALQSRPGNKKRFHTTPSVFQFR